MGMNVISMPKANLDKRMKTGARFHHCIICQGYKYQGYRW